MLFCYFHIRFGDRQTICEAFLCFYNFELAKVRATYPAASDYGDPALAVRLWSDLALERFGFGGSDLAVRLWSDLAFGVRLWSDLSLEARLWRFGLGAICLWRFGSGAMIVTPTHFFVIW